MTDSALSSQPLWWEDAGAPEAPAEAPLPAEADAVIVGAGLTGLSAARELARAGRAVVVIEAGAPGIGASSRNGGMVGGGHRLSSSELEARFGPEAAIGMLRETHIDSLDYVLRLIAEEGIDCDLQRTGRFRGLHAPHLLDAAQREIGRLQDLIGLEAHTLGAVEQQAHVSSKLYYGGAVYPRHHALNPAKYLRGLLAAAQRAGAEVHGNTPVTGVRRAQGGGFAVATARGTVRARDVLMATNGYTPGFAGALRRRIIPVPSFIIATEPLGANRVRALFPTGACIVESRDRHCYFRPSPDGARIVFGGRAAMIPIGPEAAKRELSRLMEEVFPQLGPVAITHSWRGFTGFSFDFLPAVGQIDGVWHAMGYSGSGNAMAPWLGRQAAQGILGEDAGAFAHASLSPRWWNRGRIGGMTPWYMPAVDAKFRGRDVMLRYRGG
ncbi:NAD(P)/FAD-dependent oxidoreductase [Rhodovulum sp. DZ06]|uniref:NAD(P)/FAD-dependent oxidoreductase n=1 Tax=Rhodovulum sp. DZ06 TaxID=3425126 RepID=UPI003D352E66